MARPLLSSVSIARRLAGVLGLRYRWLLVALIAIATSEIAFHSSYYATLIPTLRSELSLNYSMAQSLLSAFSLTYGLMQVPVGLLVDRYGTRRVVLASLAAFSVGAALIPFTQSYPYGLVARLLVGLGASAIYVPGLRMLTAWFPPTRFSTVMGLISIGSSFGFALALSLAPVLAAGMGWRLGYAAAAATLPIVFLLGVLFSANRPADIGLSSSLATPAHAAAVPVTVALRSVLGTKAVWPLNAASFLCYGSFMSTLAWMPTYLILELRRPAIEAGGLVGLIPLSAMVVNPLVGVLSDRLGRRLVLLVGAVLQTTVSLGFVALAPGLPTVGIALFMPLFAIASSGALNGLPLAVALVDRRFQGTTIGLANTFVFFGTFLTPIILGDLVDRAGQPHFAFFGIGALALGGFAAALGGRAMRVRG